MNLFTRAWWNAAGSRAANTAVAIAIPYVTLVLAGTSNVLYALNATAFGTLASFVTSLGGLAEVAGKVVPLWKAVLSRTAKTLGQSLVTWFGTAIIFNELNLTTFSVTVGAPVLVTLLRTLKQYLPETEPLLVSQAVSVAPVKSVVTGSSAASAVVLNDPTKPQVSA